VASDTIRDTMTRSTAGAAAGALAALLGGHEIVRIVTGWTMFPALPGTIPMPLWGALGHAAIGGSVTALALNGRSTVVRAAAGGVGVTVLVLALVSIALSLSPFEGAGFAWLTESRLLGSVTRGLESSALLLTAVAYRRPLANFLALGAATIGAVVVLGYLYGGPLLDSGGVAQVNLPAALIALCEGTGLLAINGTGVWPLRLFAGPTVTAMLLRWFLPFAALSVLITDVATIYLFRGFSFAIGSTSNTAVSMVGAALLVFFIGRIIDGRIERARTALSESEGALRRSMAELRALSTRLNGIREQERARIARDVHDRLGQALTALKMDIAELRRRAQRGDVSAVEERLGEMSAVVDDAAEDVRRVATELRPVLVDEIGFVAALKAYVADAARRAPWRCTVETSLDTLAIDADRATALFRIVQEALTNVSRHAEAQTVVIGLRAENGSVRLEIRDDGKGMAKQAMGPRAIGLTGMRDRALLFGGDVDIRSAPGRGTTVVASLPVGEAVV
jgi:signal transduction histidine kinase